MTETPLFFVPGTPDADYEKRYAGLAMFSQCAPLAPNKRIYSIVWDHDGIEWTETVGKSRHGTKTMMSRGQQTMTRHSDFATVLAIFPGVPYRVVIDAPPFGNSRSTWVNPFMAGEPKRTTLFRQP